MVYQIIWAPRALEDLSGIVNYIRSHNPEAARRFGLRLISKVESLKQFPERGRVVRKFQDPLIREIFLGPYHIIYRINPAKMIVERLAFGMELTMKMISSFD